jgi:hypothetical protein
VNRLGGDESVIDATPVEQIVMAALLGDMAIGEDDHPIVGRQPGHAMRDQYHGAVAGYAVQLIADLRRGESVQIARGFIHNEHRVTGKQRTGECESLPFSAGELVAALAGRRIQAVW